jgi:streptogrisin D
VKLHPTPWHAGLVVAAAGALAVTAAPAAQAAQPAHVSQTARTLGAGVPKPPSPAPVASSKAAQVAKQLGDRSAGSYFADPTSRKLVVTVTNDADARTVQAAGAVAQRVPRSGAQLQQVRTHLAQTVGFPGTAWYVDPRTDQVVISMDPSVSGAELAKVKSTAKSLGSAVRIKSARSRLKPLVDGGDAIWGPGLRCSLGFNVTDSTGSPAFLTAGHCGNAATDWYADSSNSQHIGTTYSSSFPGTDYALVSYDSGVGGASDVDLYNGSTQQISQAGYATVGESVERSGSTTGVHGGTVQGLNATVNYAEGTVNGLIDTNVCAEPGDSGGSLFDGSTALGLTSGGSGDCTNGGETFFQPVPDALNAFGATLP